MTFNPRRARRQVWTPTQQDNDKRLKTSWFQPNKNTLEEQEKLLGSVYYLVKQGAEFGERLRCVECRGRHDYITLKCVYKPITGLANGLYVYCRALKEAQVEHDMSPAQRSRFEQIQDVINQMPDLSSVHPQMARKMVQDIGPSDMQLGAVSLGILESISPTEARRLTEKINVKGIRPKYTLGELKQEEVDRAMSYTGPKFTRSRW